MQRASVERGVVDEEMGVLPQDRPSRQAEKAVVSHAVAKAEALKSRVHLHEPICAVLRWRLFVGLACDDKSGCFDRCDALGLEAADRRRRRNGNDAPDTRIGHGFGLPIPSLAEHRRLLKKTRDLLRRIGHL